MIRELNKVMFLGNLVMTPDFREGTETSQARTYFRMAVNHENKNKDQPWYIDVVCWDRLAKAVIDHCEKGKEVLVEGSLESRRVEGVKGLVCHVRATNIKFGSSSKKNQRQEEPQLSGREVPRTSDYRDDECYISDPYEDEPEREEETSQDNSALAELVGVIGADAVADLVTKLTADNLNKNRSRF